MFGRLMLMSLLCLTLMSGGVYTLNAQSAEKTVEKEDVGDLPGRIAIVQELLNVLQRERDQLEQQNGLLERYVAQKSVKVGGIWTGPEGKPSREINPDALKEAMKHYTEDINSVPMSGTRDQLKRILDGLWYLAFKQQGEINRLAERNQKVAGAIRAVGQGDAFDEWIKVGLQEEAERDAMLKKEMERRRQAVQEEAVRRRAETSELIRERRKAQEEYRRELRKQILEERARDRRLRELFNPSPAVYVPPGYTYYGHYGFRGPTYYYHPYTYYGGHKKHTHTKTHYRHSGFSFSYKGNGIVINVK